MSAKSGFPERIVCLTEETTETLYLLEEDWRIVGISGFTVRPPRARREKPRVSAFTSAKIDRIIELRPDLVLGFSDLQADIAAALVRAGIEVHVFNHRSVAEILRTVRVLGGMIGCEGKAAALAARLEAGVERIRAAAAALPQRPRVYFEEWDEPQISAIRWVSELMGIAGGDDCFPELAQASLGKDRIIADTKFEFGVDAAGRLTLIDEVLTPDSSRFWPMDRYVVGTSPPSFDKQFVRDYLETLDWDKRAPGPALPPEIIAKTSENYLTALRRLTGPVTIG